MSRVTLLNLETLCCIAQLGTFAAAARKMHASQPAISARIRDIESVMGVKLFQRQGRRMELTWQGRDLVQLVEPLLRRLDGAVGQIDNPASMTGTVRMAAGEIAALSWFPVFMARLRQLMPRVSYEIDVDLTTSMNAKLSNGKTDVALLAGPVVAKDVHSMPLGSVRMMWMTSPLMRQALQDAATPQEIVSRQPIWSLSYPSASHNMTMSMLEEWGIESARINTCNHIMSLIAMIATGAGTALLPEILVRDHIARAELVPLFPHETTSKIQFVIAWRSDMSPTVLRNIVDMAQQCSSFERGD
ncbi:LysR family transcriptional regulator [Hydrogenophaga sp. BPS33]|uniref:LysR family transcriptional regulator n=1 Tax=Hydrogenophaga sp. BPS33 TaxID=2651974 RepID=UPI00131F5008|nr:LysR family transcriptional regulator [Hydrogenophaga sp. BPS33]QHE84847.1 LysR family transcriptional regulator [Hydrogenophaga sp. BPS33]